MEAIEKRRSVRNFDPNYVIPKELLQRIMDATHNSPTSLNGQEIDLIFIINKEIITKIDKASWDLIKDEEVRNHFIDRQKRYGFKNLLTYDCSALVLFVTNPERVRNPARATLDAGIAVGTLLSVTEAAGLNSVTLGMLVNSSTEEIVGITKGNLAMAVAIGKTRGLDVDKKEFVSKVTLIE